MQDKDTFVQWKDFMDDKCSLWKHQQRSYLSLFSSKCFSITVQFACCFILTSLTWCSFSFPSFCSKDHLPLESLLLWSLIFFLKKNSLMAMVQHKVNIIHALMIFFFCACYANLQYIMWEKLDVFAHYLCYSSGIVEIR